MVSRELGEAVATPRCGTQAATVRREDGFAVANLGSRRFARHEGKRDFPRLAWSSRRSRTGRIVHDPETLDCPVCQPEQVTLSRALLHVEVHLRKFLTMARRVAVMLARLIEKRNLGKDKNYEKKINEKSVNKKKIEKKTNRKSVNKKKIGKKTNGKSVNKKKIEKKVIGRALLRS